MSSDSELSGFSELYNSTEEEDVFDEEDNDVEVILTQVTPYEDEPLADIEEDAETVADDEETDVDGLTPAVLEARYERETAVNSWFV